jgi:hypothetical protein
MKSPQRFKPEEVSVSYSVKYKERLVENNLKYLTEEN